ncbi:MAG TPA: hypothetical protein VHM27_11040 [Rhizomicrobium sp.]|jgi:hypothetical protein|nr:hypothetical protein [Rhizomicrobium sp.]
MFARIFFAIFLMFSGLLAVSPDMAQAQPRYGRGEMRDGVQPLDRLLPGIRRSHPGEFYDAEGPTYGPSGEARYHLKWMTPDGRIIWYDADARSGRVLRSSPGRDSFDDRRRNFEERRQDFDDRRGDNRRYGPYMSEPYDRGYGRARERENERYAPNFAPNPRYGNPYGGGRRGGEGRGRWRRDR